MSHSPCPWETHEQIPFFPAGAPPIPPAFNLAEIDAMVVLPAAAAEPKQKGPVVRLAEFLPEPPAGVPQFQPSMFDLPSGQDSQGFCFNMSGLPMPPLMPGSDATATATFLTGIDGMTAPSCPPQYPMEGQQQWQFLQQQFQPQMQQQQQLFQPQMHMTVEMQHQQQQQQMPPQQMPQELQFQPPQPQPQPEQMQTQMQQIQMQMQQMQPHQMQRMQPPTM